MASITTARERKKYEQVELQPLASAVDGDDEDDPSKLSPMDQWLHYILHKLHALLWLVLAGTVIWMTDLFAVIIDGSPPERPEARLNRCETIPTRSIPSH